MHWLKYLEIAFVLLAALSFFGGEQLAQPIFTNVGILLLGMAGVTSSAFPINVDLVPGKLAAHVYLHEIDTRAGTILCWSYVSDGLLAYQQKELLFTLRCDRNEPPQAFPQDPLHLFEFIGQLAQKGQYVDAGGVTQFGDRNFLGRHLAYIQPQALEGVSIPTAALAAILVTEDEVTAVQEFGITRVMSRLGFASRYYPCPPWSDRTRPSISFARTRETSVLARVARVHTPGVTVLQAENRIILHLASRAREQLQQNLSQMPINTPIALLTDLDPSADGCFVWEPGQSEPVAITPPNSKGSRLCGCFVLFLPEQDKDGGQLFEDGFTLWLTKPSWIAIRQALMQGQNINVPAADDGMPISVEWAA